MPASTVRSSRTAWKGGYGMAQSLFLESDNSVDFLYLDKQRISSLIGQLSDRGMLTGFKSVVGKSQATEGVADLGVPLLAKAEGSTLEHPSKARRRHMILSGRTYIHFYRIWRLTLLCL
jgi:hypothetical protein